MFYLTSYLRSTNIHKDRSLPLSAARRQGTGCRSLLHPAGHSNTPWFDATYGCLGWQPIHL